MNAAVTTVETDTIARMLRLGCQLIRLAPGVKTPKGGESWKLNPTITTVEEALDWVAAGGGLGAWVSNTPGGVQAASVGGGDNWACLMMSVMAGCSR